MLRTLAAVAGGVATGVLFTPSVATSSEVATRIIDRTVDCRAVGTGFPDPVRVMTVAASPRNDAQRLPPLLSAHNGPSGEGGVSAFIQTGPDPSHPTGSVSYNRKRCTPTKRPIALSSRGLTGGSTHAAEGESYKCNLPARILIRIRAVFVRPTRFSGDAGSPWLSIARGTMTTAHLAVATMPSRKPLFLATATHSTGGARAFVAASHCVSR
jgi:hypothetical protein